MDPVLPKSRSAKASNPSGVATSWPVIGWLLLLGCLVTGVSAWAGYRQNDVLRYFDEGSVLSWLSGLQLISVGVIAGAIYRLRRQQQTSWRSSQLLWLLVAVGFIFLAADELAQIHESIDRSIHQIWQIQKRGLRTGLMMPLLASMGP